MLKGDASLDIIHKIAKIILQICLIMLITQAGNLIQRTFHIPLAGSIIGLILFFCLLQTGVVRASWINEGANFLLTTMIFFFLPSIISLKDVIGNINSSYIIFFILIAVGTVLVAFVSGYIAEKLTISRKEGHLS